MLDALPDIVTEFPDVVYIVLGATHPNELRTNGKAYRVGLEAVVKKMSPRIRKYCIGAFLLDRDDPTKVIGRLPEPLIKPNATERNGDVPHVVHSCGGPRARRAANYSYGISDHAATFGSIPLAQVLAAMESSHDNARKDRIRLRTSVGIARQEITP